MSMSKRVIRAEDALASIPAEAKAVAHGLFQKIEESGGKVNDFPTFAKVVSERLAEAKRALRLCNPDPHKGRYGHMAGAGFRAFKRNFQDIPGLIGAVVILPGI
jgi:hypothetical protein